MKNLQIITLFIFGGLLLFSACKKKQSAIIQTDTGADTNYIATRSVPHVDWAKNASIYEVNIRQYTKEGTFKAFEEHLPRLQKLGVDILWLMPITPISEKNRKGTMGSYYAVQDYKKVNPEFGTEQDFQELVNKIHKLGMKVILDWVPNHTGWDNTWITEHPDWFTKNEKGEIIPPNPDWTDVADLNYDNQEMRKAMIDALKYWITTFDIDGYRCDVAGSVPTDFWNDARSELGAIKPIFMLAEAWEPQLAEDAFDMIYGWDMHHTMNKVAKGEKNVDALFEQIAKDAKRYSKDTYIMQFITNHDENSWNGTVKERMGNGAKPFAVLSFTIPGMPLIYSGQEAGLDKRLAFFEKDEISWENTSLQTFYTKLDRLKKENPALWNGMAGGTFLPIVTNNERVMAFAREKEDNKVVVVLNFSDKPQKIAIDDEVVNTDFEDYCASKKILLKTPLKQLTLQAWEYRIFIR